MVKNIDEIVNLAKRRGFIFQASEIYGGTGSVWDYGPLGVELKRNFKDLWWKKFVTSRDDVIGLDSAIIQSPKVWEASGHLKNFTDPLVECKKCHMRFREDHIAELKSEIRPVSPTASRGGNPKSEIIQEQKAMIECSKGGNHEFTPAKQFNLMFKTYIGPVEDSASEAYLRPETAQGIFINFPNVLQSTRIKMPFGIAQIGKSFRNEITPGNFIFRTREFEQGEVEYFIKPDKEESAKWYEYWIDQVMGFYINAGIKKENLSVREHSQDELSHYSIGTSDIEYNFPFGVSELAGVAQRTDFDLKQHEKFSGKSMVYTDPETSEKFIPYVVEPSMGIDRAILALLVDAYDVSDGTDGRAEGELTLHLSPKLAPIKAAIFPLVKKDKLPEIARKIYDDLKKYYPVFYDETASIGRRYRRQDEIGTPYCITVDFDSLEDDSVTIRDRDSLKQERIKIDEIKNWLRSNLA